MNKLTKILIALVLVSIVSIVSIASAALMTEYLRDERTVEVQPWMSFDVNNDPRDITHGDMTLYDYINITSHKKYSSTCEIDTVIKFNGEELEDQNGISVSYSVETGSGSLIPAPDINNNSMPEAAVFGMQDLESMGDPDGNFTIRRNIAVNEDLMPGSYSIVTILIPYQGNET